MAKPNPSRDYASKLAEDIGFTVINNSIYRDWRNLYLHKEVNALQGETLPAWKSWQYAELKAKGFVSDYYGEEMKGGVENGVVPHLSAG